MEQPSRGASLARRAVSVMGRIEVVVYTVRYDLSPKQCLPIIPWP
jgi:hypothetical protein